MPGALAGRADDTALAARFAPVLQLVADTPGCGEGETYIPLDVDALFGNPTVALRGPWGNDLVAIGPTAKDLAKGLYEYHLDFPGTALSPGCTYLQWQRRIAMGHKPTAYAHIVKEPGFPDKLALQYWFFYVFNDWNNLHEGDWEMIQLDFDAKTAAQALHSVPVEVGYSQHEGAERSTWDAPKLQLVDGTHPVIHPALGSHANFYGGEALYLGASASQGVGCDDTRGRTFDVRPVVRLIPSEQAEALAAFPWIDFQGRWGELRPAFFNGPTGPNLKPQWTEPILWSETWRAQSLTVPGATAFGPGATGFFCSAIGAGSRGLVQLVNRPLEIGLALAALVLLLVFGLSRATWRPTAPLHLASRRAWGQILAAAARMYVERLRFFIGLGLVLLPISLLVTLLQALVLHTASVFGVQSAGQRSGFTGLLVLAIGTALTLTGLGLVQAACACALAEIDRGRDLGVLRAYRLAFARIRALFTALVVVTVIVSLLASSIFALPIAIWLAGRWALIVPTIELEGTTGLGALGRSSRLVRGRWLKASSLIVAGGALVFVAGPLVGIALIVTTSTPFWLVNVIAGVVYAVAMPIVGLTTVYTYADLRVRDELDREREPPVLAAEIELAT